MLAQEADSIPGVLLHDAGNVDADQCDFPFIAIWQPSLFERDVLPEEAALLPTSGQHLLVPVGADQREHLTGDGGDAGNLGDARGDSVGDGAAEQLGGPAAPDGQVGTVLLNALSHILLNALRQAV